jgi:hypothetical protein
MDGLKMRLGENRWWNIGLAKRDVLWEYAEAFRKAGLAVGFYFSVWDRHHGIDGRPLLGGREPQFFMQCQQAKAKP